MVEDLSGFARLLLSGGAAGLLKKIRVAASMLGVFMTDHKGLLLSILFLLIGMVQSACGGGSGSTNADSTAPISMTYSVNPAIYTKDVSISANTPTFTGGAATSFAVNPPLPPGLSLDATSGIITGKPTAATAAADYTVTAWIATGKAEVTLSISVSTPLLAPNMKFHPGLWALTGIHRRSGGPLDQRSSFAKPCYVGTVGVYYWCDLETDYAQYNFDIIRQDLNGAKAAGKKFGIYLRGEATSPVPATPSYMLNDPNYGGVIPGLYGNYLGASGQNAASAIWWNAKLKERWKAFLQALATEFDTDPDVSFFLWKEETTRGATTANDPNYTCAGDVNASKEIVSAAHSMFKHTPFR